MKLLKYFNLPELLILAIGMLTFKIGFLDHQEDILLSLSLGNYMLFIFATVLVAAGGFFINNVFGYGKEPNLYLTESKGYNIYFILNIVGIGIIYYLANMLGKPMILTGVYVLAAATMYFYATSLKEMAIVNNILVALLSGLPVLAIGLFQLYPVIGISSEDSKGLITLLFKIIIDYSVFISIVSLALSIINDLINTDADYNAGLNTLPIMLGRGRAAKVVVVLLVLPIGLFIYYANVYLLNLLYALAYGIVFMVGLLIYSIIKTTQAKSARDFVHIADIVRLVILFTAFSIAVITFNINYVKH